MEREDFSSTRRAERQSPSAPVAARAADADAESAYRPLPEFGTPEFAEELERRSRNPGRVMTIEEFAAALKTV